MPSSTTWITVRHHFQLGAMLKSGKPGKNITSPIKRYFYAEVSLSRGIVGIPIGSGMVASACKWLITQRFKGTGMRWSEAGFKQENLS